MKNFLIYIPVTALYLSFKTTVTPGLPVPDITVLIVFFAASRKPSLDVAILAFTLGYIEDIFAGGVLGSSSFSLVFVFAAVVALLRWLEFSTLPAKVIASAALSLLKGTLTWMVLNLSGLEIGFNPGIALVAATTGLSAPLFIALLRRITGRTSLIAEKKGA